MNDMLYTIALHKVLGVGVLSLKTILSEIGSVKELFTCSKNDLLQIKGVGEITATKIIESRDDALRFAEQELVFVQNKQIDVLTQEDNKYPNRLKFCEDAPMLLFSKGIIDYNAQRVIAVVGTRNISNYGKKIVEELIQFLQANKVVVVSGLAYGVDTEVHRGCVKYNVPTVGVLAHGLDQVYPPVNRKLAASMLNNGSLLTEYPSGTMPDRQNFPTRNRIVAGMADATIIIESAEKGGSLITAEIANTYQRDVFAFPGAINYEYSKGCNMLIKKQKAWLIENGEDLFRALNWNSDNSSKQNRQRKLFVDLNEHETTIVKLLMNEPLSAEILSVKSLLPLSIVQTHLLNLEIQGVIRTLPGNLFTVN